MTKQRLTIIFLDIDGVLLPFGGDTLERKKEKSCSGLFPDRTLQALSDVCRRSRTPISLVLSSTWRVRPEFCQQILQAFQTFNECFQGSLPSDFYDITNAEHHSERQWEIHEWIMGQEQSVESWVCLDDEELLEEEKNAKYRPFFEGHVVKTKSSVGLTMNDAEKALHLLQQHLVGK